MSGATVPWSLKLAYWTALLVDVAFVRVARAASLTLKDAPLFGIRRFQTVLLPERALTPELRLIAQGKATSNLAFTVLAVTLGLQHSPASPTGRLVARIFLIVHVVSTALSVRYGLIEPTQFQQPMAAVLTHASWALLASHGLWTAQA